MKVASLRSYRENIKYFYYVSDAVKTEKLQITYLINIEHLPSCWAYLDPFCYV